MNELWAIDTTNRNIYRFRDTLCKSGPVTSSPSEVNIDPTTGRNTGISLVWKPISTDDQFEVQIALDKDFTIRIPTAEPPTNPFYTPPQVTNPAYYLPPGQLPKAGATYYWRVRTRHATTGETISSQWSEVKSFTVKAGLPLVAVSSGPQLLFPQNGSSDIPVSPAFSWTTLPDVTEYEFILAKDANLKDIVVKEYVTSNAYRYTKKLDYNTTYFWQVRATKPVSSVPSPISYFTTVKETPSQPTSTSLPPVAKSSSIYIWVAIGIIFALLFLILILLLQTRRTSPY